MLELYRKEGWALNSWCFWTMVLEKTRESLLNSKEIKLVSPKGNQPWIFIGRSDAEAEVPTLGHLIWRANSLEKTLMLEKIEGRRRSGWRWTVNEMAGWHHWLNGPEFERTLGDSERQGILMCCSPQGCEESDTTSGLNSNKQCSKSSWYEACISEPNIGFQFLVETTYWWLNNGTEK